MQLEGDLSGNQEQEVRLDVSHRLLHHCLLRKRPPVRRVDAVGRVNGGTPLLLCQALQETSHLLPKEEEEVTPPEYLPRKVSELAVSP